MAVIINDLEVVAAPQQSDAVQGDSGDEQLQASPPGQTIQPFTLTRIRQQQLERYERIHSH